MMILRDRRFEELSAKLRQKEVIDVSGDMLSRIIQLFNWGRNHRPLIEGTVGVLLLFISPWMSACIEYNAGFWSKSPMNMLPARDENHFCIGSISSGPPQLDTQA